MIEADPSAMQVFARWRNAPTNAFGSKNRPGVIPTEDKKRYSLIYNELMHAAQSARDKLSDPSLVEIKSMNYSHEYGSRGHRPVDIWVSICGANSEAFARMPQIYAIASERGLEIGFAISISEDDYYDPSVKSRNRTIVPLINQKLPSSDDDLTKSISEKLTVEGGWHFNKKARLSPDKAGFGEWSSFSDLIQSIKVSGSSQGGGSICKFYAMDELLQLDLDAEFSHIVEIFLPVLLRCAPNSWDSLVTTAHKDLDSLSEEVEFDPTDITDAREKVLRAIAQRRGQKKFRRMLLKAYKSSCAISQTSVEEVLEAAHITPYLGEDTNTISNGLLLRTDLHTLFDLFLIKINPESLQVEVAPSLASTPYWRYNQQRIHLPAKSSDHPSALALAQHYNS
ncbi:HNH endonuclease [Celeribacter halophilus]|uniref:HNH endonuclease n=1 Tax=Celeribacter halophilus TaxID=576117 RepID=A0AAW7XPG3_9RHOB|nr:HNH endonuclease [Celeribacter halophilus]MDO6455607.1 HNH endonuclease [Celeribacter halophilus]